MTLNSTYVFELKKTKIILLENGEIEFPDKCFLNSTDGAVEFDLKLTHPCLMEEPFLSWLSNQLEMTFINPVDIIRVHFFELLQSKTINLEESIQLLQYVFETFVAYEDSLTGILPQLGAVFPIFISDTDTLCSNECLIPSLVSVPPFTPTISIQSLRS